MSIIDLDDIITARLNFTLWEAGEGPLDPQPVEAEPDIDAQLTHVLDRLIAKQNEK